MKTNLACKLLAAIVLATCAAACVNTPPPRHFAPGQWVSENRDQLQATGIALAKIAARDAGTALMNGAISYFDSTTKGNYLDAAAFGLRSEMPNIINSGDVANVARIWTPAATGPAHWEVLSKQLADAYVKGHPTDSKTRLAVIEAMAEGLNQAAIQPTSP